MGYRTSAVQIFLVYLAFLDKILLVVYGDFPKEICAQDATDPLGTGMAGEKKDNLRL